MSSFMKLALRLAEKSKHNKQKMACVVVSGGRVISHATNFQRWSHHAEVRALALAGNTDGATVYVARVGARMSKPCPMCQALLREHNIKCAIYIDNDGRQAHMTF